VLHQPSATSQLLSGSWSRGSLGRLLNLQHRLPGLSAQARLPQPLLELTGSASRSCWLPGRPVRLFTAQPPERPGLL